MNIIINADDFGYSRGVNFGIVDSFKLGILTSTTLMVNMPGTEHAVKLSKSVPELGVGLHLNLTLGYPLTNGKSLIDKSNQMIKPTKMSNTHIYDESEIYNEIDAQYKAFLKLMGKVPTHIDSHLFSTDKIDKIKKVAIEYAIDHNIPLRNHTINKFPNVKFINHRNYNSSPSLEYILENFSKIKQFNHVEIMCHPGYVDSFVLKNSSYNVQRANEVEFLTSKETKEFFLSNNVNFISYKNISEI